MQINIDNISFSRYGSFLSISNYKTPKELGKGLYIRNIRGGDENLGNFLLVELIENNVSIDYDIEMTPSLLTLKGKMGKLEFILSEQNEIRIRGSHCKLRLTLNNESYDHIISHENNNWEFNSYSKHIKSMFVPLAGKTNVIAPWNEERSEKVQVELSDDNIECVLHFYKGVYLPKKEYEKFDSCLEAVNNDFNKWISSFPTPKDYNYENNLAAYVLWNNVVFSEGVLSHDSVYMSKNWMTNIWSWDNCFVAMSLIENHPKLAWDQLLVFYATQDESGLFPDYVNDKYASFSCCKPPIHGWTIKYLYEKNPDFFSDKLDIVYDMLSKWTNFWLQYRTYENDIIPKYFHGNDSGWDNSTIFHDGGPIESPDLISFLITQMNFLAEVAEKIGLNSESLNWKNKSTKFLDILIKEFWNGKKFIARKIEGNKKLPVTAGDSLISFIPLILGNLLPENILEELVNGLKEDNRFLTPYGLATESISSSFYNPDGYWRGPIWAPVMMIIIDSLNRAGKTDFSNELRKKYLNLIKTGGLAENFNAKTGEGLRDKGFAWTSAVFLILNDNT
ncbi:MAG: hypothetical protein KBF12_03670 [Sebaldella sp.]|nr:hypothetical protein [Sebaldella sp.]